MVSLGGPSEPIVLGWREMPFFWGFGIFTGSPGSNWYIECDRFQLVDIIRNDTALYKEKRGSIPSKYY